MVQGYPQKNSRSSGGWCSPVPPSDSVPSSPSVENPVKKDIHLRGFTDMRCKHSRVLSVIREQLHREPSDGDIYIVMSKDRRIVRLFAYDNRSYSLFEEVCFGLSVYAYNQG